MNKGDNMGKANNPKHMENIIGKGFDKHPENINKNGRPKTIYKQLRDEGIPAEDIRNVFRGFANYTLAELREIYEDHDMPIIMRITAKEYYNGFKQGFRRIAEMLRQGIGSPDLSIELTGRLSREEIATQEKYLKDRLNRKKK